MMTLQKSTVFRANVARLSSSPLSGESLGPRLDETRLQELTVNYVLSLCLQAMPVHVYNEEVLGYRRISASAQVGLLSALSHMPGTSCENIATPVLASLYGSSWYSTQPRDAGIAISSSVYRSGNDRCVLGMGMRILARPSLVPRRIVRLGTRLSKTSKFC